MNVGGDFFLWSSGVSSMTQGLLSVGGNFEGSRADGEDGQWMWCDDHKKAGGQYDGFYAEDALSGEWELRIYTDPYGGRKLDSVTMPAYTDGGNG